MSVKVDTDAVSFSKIREDLMSWVSSRSDLTTWKDYYASSSGTMLVELLAGTMMFNALESIASRREAYLPNVKTIGAARAGAESLGYSAYRGQNQHFRLHITPTVSDFYPKFYPIASIGDKSLYTLEEYTVTAGESAFINVVVGEFKSSSVTIPDDLDRRFQFLENNVSDDISVELTTVAGTNEVLFTEEFKEILNGQLITITNSYGGVDVYTINPKPPTSVTLDSGVLSTFTADGVNPDLTLGTIDDAFVVDAIVQFKTSDTLPAGLSLLTDYYIVSVGTSTIQVSATQGGIVITPSDTGVGSHTATIATIGTGVLVAGTYEYYVTGLTDTGETLASTLSTMYVDGAYGFQSIKVSWDASYAGHYRVYRKIGADNYQYWDTYEKFFIDTGAVGAFAEALPTTDIYNYAANDSITLKYILLQETNLIISDVVSAYGAIDAEQSSLVLDYQDPESVDSIKVSAPIHNEVKGLIKGRNDYAKLLHSLSINKLSKVTIGFNQYDRSQAIVWTTCVMPDESGYDDRIRRPDGTGLTIDVNSVSAGVINNYGVGDGGTGYAIGDKVSAVGGNGDAVGTVINVVGTTVAPDAPSTFTTNYVADNALTPTTMDTTFIDDSAVYLTTTGTLPAGLAVNTTYYVINATSTTVELSLTQGGTAVTLTDDGSGTHTMTVPSVVLTALGTGYSDSVTATTFNTAVATGLTVRIDNVIEDGKLSTVIIKDAGTGYEPGHKVLVTGGDSNGLIEVLTETGGVPDIVGVVTGSEGTSYTNYTTTTVDPTPIASGLTVDVITDSGVVTSAVVNVAGTDYAVGDIVNVISGANDAQLTIASTGEALGDVLTLTVLDGGTGYPIDPTAVATSFTTQAATGLKVRIDTVSAGVITAVTIIDGGTGYAVGTVVDVIGGNSDAQLTVNNITGHIVTGFETISAGGTGYADDATTTFESSDASGFTISIDTVGGSGDITGATLVTGGTGYVVNDTVKVSGGGDDAVLTINSLSGSAVATFTITTPGTGYPDGIKNTNFLSRGAISTFTAVADDANLTLITPDATFITSEVVRFTTTTTLPAGLAVDTDYYIVSHTDNNIQVSTTAGGDVIAPTDAGTGVHTVTLQKYDTYRCIKGHIASADTMPIKGPLYVSHWEITDYAPSITYWSVGTVFESNSAKLISYADIHRPMGVMPPVFIDPKPVVGFVKVDVTLADTAQTLGTTQASVEAALVPFSGILGINFKTADVEAVLNDLDYIRSASVITDKIVLPYWEPNVYYSTGERIRPTAGGDYYYKCTTAGTSGTVEPIWPLIVGNDETDNGITWRTEFYSDVSWGPRTDYDLDTVVVPKVPNGYYYKCIQKGDSSATEPTWATETDGMSTVYLGTGKSWTIDEYVYATNGSGCTVTTTAVNGVITGAVVVAGGTNYIVGDTVIVDHGNGDAVLKVLTLSGSAVATFTVFIGGTGYTSDTPVNTYFEIARVRYKCITAGDTEGTDESPAWPVTPGATVSNAGGNVEWECESIPDSSMVEDASVLWLAIENFDGNDFTLAWDEYLKGESELTITSNTAIKV